MMHRPVLLLGLLLGPQAWAAAPPDHSVTLDPASRARLGITTAAATAKPYRAESRGLGQVLGLEILAQTDADLSVAEAAARTSQAALARAQSMFAADTGISRQALEAAEQQAATDAAQLALAQRKSLAAWGRDAPWRNAAQRRALLARIAAGEVAVIRATFPSGIVASDTPPAMRIESLRAPASAEAMTAKTVWAGPADPNAPGRVYFMLVEGPADLAEGDRVRVIAATGAGKDGAYVPAGAVIVAEGSTWLYIEDSAHHFLRRPVDISVASGDGYVVLNGIAPGAKVVTAGAAHLLARETGTTE